MSNVVALQSGFSGAQLDLIRRTVAADCTPAEFDLFIATAKLAGLSPIKKQIGAIVFNKSKPDKRRMVIVTYIDGLRAVADRSGAYSPDEAVPLLEYDESLKGPLNPHGLISAVVNVFKNGRKVPGIAYWDEFAPITDEWGEDEQTGRRKKTGRQVLDTSGQWGKMGRLMLAKCAEAQALRKAFPEDTSGLYEYAEMDRSRVEELSASEIVGQHQTQGRLDRIGAGATITLQFSPQEPLVHVPLGQVADRIAEAMQGYGGTQMVDWFSSVNQQPLREFWARAQSDALSAKKLMERRRAELAAEEEKASA